MSSITKNVLLHLAPQLPIAYSPTLQTHIIIANMLLMIFMTAVNDIHDQCNPLPTCLDQAGKIVAYRSVQIWPVSYFSTSGSHFKSLTR